MVPKKYRFCEASRTYSLFPCDWVSRAPIGSCPFQNWVQNSNVVPDFRWLASYSVGGTAALSQGHAFGICCIRKYISTFEANPMVSLAPERTTNTPKTLPAVSVV